MSKSEWLEVIQALVTSLMIFGSKYIKDARNIFKDFEEMKKKQFIMEQSLKAAWEKIDKLKKIPHGGEI